MEQGIVTAITEGLKEAGTEFVVSLPSTGTKFVIPAVASDPYFRHIPVANESDGISICFGVWLGGKKPVFLAENSGFVLSAHALMNVIYRFGGFPLMLVLDHRGVFGDGVAEWYFAAGTIVPSMLKSFQIPYTIVRESNQIKASLVRAQRTTEAYGKPVAVLLSVEEMW